MKSDNYEVLKYLSKKLVEKLSKNRLKISFAESITGGLFVSSLTRISGVSKVLSESFVTYSEQAKNKILNVGLDVIEQYSVYSLEVVKQMLFGLKKISSADVLLAVSGVAGPDKPDEHSVGEVYFAIAINDKTFSFKELFEGDREEIQYQTVVYGFNKILEMIEQNY